MFITTSRNGEALAEDGADAGWPGPRLLRIDPDSGYGAEERRAAEAHYDAVFDYVTPPNSSLDSLRTMILRAAHRPAWPTGPLLFTETALDADEAGQLAAETARDPHFLETAHDSSGSRLVRLTLGAAIVEHPLFLTLFRNMKPGLDESQSEQSLDVLSRHLRPASDTGSGASVLLVRRLWRRLTGE